MKKKMIIAAVLWLIGLAACIWVYHNRQYLRTFDASEWNVEETLQEALVLNEESNSLAVSGEASGAIETDGMIFDAGTYVFAVSYSETEDGDVFQVVSDTQMAADGTVGRIYAEIPMEVSGDRARAEVTFDTDVYDVRMRVIHKAGDLKITESVWRNTDAYRDPVILYLLWSAAAGVMYALYLGDRSKRSKGQQAGSFVTAGVILFFAVITTIPYFNDFLIYGHDLDFHLARIEGLTKALRNGTFPVWINPAQNNGYGYSAALMYPQVFLYVPAILHGAGLSLINSYKVLMFFINLGAAACGYIGFRGIFRRHDMGLLGCALWSMSMYRLDSLYIRAAVGEALGLAFLPLLFWGLYELFFRDRSKWWIATVGFSCVIGSHLLSTEMYVAAAAVFFIISMCVNKDRVKRLLDVLRAAGLCLLVNLFYIVPFLDYYLHGIYNSTNTQLAGIYLKDRTVYLSQIFNTFLHNAGSGNIAAGTTENEMPLSLGLMSLVGLIFTAYVVYEHCSAGPEEDGRCRTADSAEDYGFMLACTAAALITVFVLSWLIPWDVLIKISPLYKGTSTIQFIWRILGIASIFIAAAITAAASVWTRKHGLYRRAFIMAAVILAVILGWPSIDTPLENKGYPGAEYTAFNAHTDYLYMYRDGDLEAIEARGMRVLTSDEDLKVTSFEKDGLKVSCDITADAAVTGGCADLPLYFYPGYRVYVNGTETDAVRSADCNTVQASLPDMAAGDTVHVEASFHAPWYWNAAYVISAAAAAGWCIMYFGFGRRKHAAPADTDASCGSGEGQ